MWDVGFIDGKFFYWCKKDYYFFMDFEYFISMYLLYMNNDLIISEIWQLLDKFVDLKIYFKFVKLEEGFVYFGVFFCFYKDIIIYMKGEVCIEI